ncbi:hypothetical protein ACFYT4_28300 [Streptomyces sp. NPDC004609]|uniref:hypothetical protein n=1 Tax=Streptomyces sp. NPDC004609 TaxID=3364704 RepID=UPI0036B4E5CD
MTSYGCAASAAPRGRHRAVRGSSVAREPAPERISVLSRVGKTMMGTGVALALGTLVTSVVIMTDNGAEGSTRNRASPMDLDLELGGGPAQDGPTGAPEEESAADVTSGAAEGARAGASDSVAPVAGRVRKPAAGTAPRAGRAASGANTAKAERPAGRSAPRVPAPPRERPGPGDGDGCRHGNGGSFTGSGWGSAFGYDGRPGSDDDDDDDDDDRDYGDGGRDCR